MNPRSATVALVIVLVASTSLAGCINSAKDPEDREFGALFVKRSCREVTPTAVVDGAASASAPAFSLPQVSFQQGERPEIVLGVLLPSAGPDAAHAEDMRRAALLAEAQLNEALASGGGAVPQIMFRLVFGDEGSNAAEAAAATRDLMAQGAIAVVGGTTAATTDGILDAAVGNAPVVAPGATAPSLSLDRDNNGFFYRVRPSEALQGHTLADLLWWDGCQTASVVSVANETGKGVTRVFRQEFQAKGGGVASVAEFQPGAADARAAVLQAARDDPDAVLVVASAADGAKIVEAAFAEGKMKKSVWFFSDGMRTSSFVEAVGQAENPETRRTEWIVAGLKGTAPDFQGGPRFQQFEEDYAARNADDFNGPGKYAAETYDGVLISALAATAATRESGDRVGERVRDQIALVANRNGPADVPTDGRSIREGLIVMATGGNVDYRGASQDSDFDAKGDPVTANYLWWKVEDNGAVQTMKTNVKPGEPPQ